MASTDAATRRELWMDAARDAGWIPPGRKMCAVTLPFRDDGRMVVGALTVPRPLSSEEWDYMMSVLDAMRPGLVSDADTRDSRDLSGLRLAAEIALHNYAAVLRHWNAPDDEHTRIQIRNLAEDVIDTEVPE